MKSAKELFQDSRQRIELPVEVITRRRPASAKKMLLEMRDEARLQWREDNGINEFLLTLQISKIHAKSRF